MGFAGIAIAAMTRRIWRLAGLAAGLAVLAIAAPASAKNEVTPLFAGSETLNVEISGPIEVIARSAARSTDPHDATLAANGETHAIALSARGITRRMRVTCQFPPLGVVFKEKPAASSLFAGQRRMKLVTHCRPNAGFDQFLLKEYAAYRLYNQLTDKSLKVRLARIRYVDAGKLVAERMGFFIEDIDDAGRRLGMKKVEASGIRTSALNREDAARLTLFQYMIGNLDWDMTHGPTPNECCHNSKLLGPPSDAREQITPVPYDFDYSGLVNAPYAVPPTIIPIQRVTQRYYRGLCSHSEETRRQVAEFISARGRLEAELGRIPGLDRSVRASMENFLSGFFADVATPEGVDRKLVKACRKNL